MLPLSLFNILLLSLTSALGCATQDPQGTDQPLPAQAENAPATPDHPDPEVDRILTELETADRGMRDLRAGIVYDRIDRTLGDRQYRFGDLLFRDRTPEGQTGRAGMRSFVVCFDRYADLDVTRDLNESWAFDGRWLIERNDDDKTFRKREITRVGEEVDPLRLGEGPLPIPIGQRKADILERYEVELVDPTDSLEAPADPADKDEFASYREAVASTGAVQLKLTPRTEDEDGFDSVRLWYWKSPDDPDRWLPLMARAAKTNAKGREMDIAFVLMVGVKVNRGVTDEEMTVPEPGPGDGYTVQIDRLPVEGGGQ
jgi:hypothetical protein